ncbi:phosphotransferase family enzyme [Roseinatronobacter thiooxidans]|uniref:Phosphotransferase family enzyme n=1 Tax=Roseinatronobacter thiooxidans TaxID=121821 RepID=A0A2W7Q8F9_9RHOB|nr:aminoglycoside phosphotransferase family protein [Roseinatronobacter thiooxidans]PZX42090.1 phosphotransferase family enzyme [Roseinatronobacter thiooxidans]
MIAPLRALVQRRQGHAALQQVANAAFPTDPPRIAQVIKQDARSCVARATWQGREVIVKQHHVADPVPAMQALHAEHDRLRALFPVGKLHAATCLATAPEAALVILPFATGTRLDHVIPDVPAPMRAELVQLAGQWLAHSLGREATAGQFSPGFWVKMVQAELAAAPLGPNDSALVQAVIQRLGERAPPLRGLPVPKGPIHQDFAPHNILWDADRARLSVIDIDKRTDLPIALDMARLLSGLTHHLLCATPDMPLHKGLCPDLRAALLSVGALAHEGPNAGIFDFLTGVRLAKVLIAHHGLRFGPPARATIQNWLETVPCP